MIEKVRVEDELKKVHDPELGIDVFTLGLIYKIEVSEDKVNIEMTFTSPMCPYGPQLVSEIKSKIESLEDVSEAKIDVVFTPVWEPSEEVRTMLGV